MVLFAKTVTGKTVSFSHAIGDCRRVFQPDQAGLKTILTKMV
jgi:hypothetical protein